MTPLAVAERFVAYINTHDVDGLAGLATPDHRFIDSLGTVVEGRDRIRFGWQAYFDMVPEYHLDIDRRFSSETEVVLIGKAHGYYGRSGRLEDTAWSTPVALRASIRGDEVAEWQVYADNEPIRELMRRVSA